MEAKEETKLEVIKTSKIDIMSGKNVVMTINEGSGIIHFEIAVSFYGIELGDTSAVLLDACGHVDDIKNGKHSFDTFHQISDGELLKIITDSYNTVTCEEGSKIVKVHIGGDYSKVIMLVKRIEDELGCGR